MRGLPKGKRRSGVRTVDPCRVMPLVVRSRCSKEDSRDMNLPAGDGHLGPLDHLWVSNCLVKKFDIYSRIFCKVTVSVFLQYRKLCVIRDSPYIILRVQATE